MGAQEFPLGAAWAVPRHAVQPVPAELAAAPAAPDRLASDLALEVAAPLTAALDRLDRLRETGQIDTAGLAELRAQVERARQAAMIGQRLGRLSGGQIRQVAERLDLTRLLREVVDECSPVMAQSGLELREILRPAEVVVDATLAFSLVKALLEWSAEHACERVELAVEFKTWPIRARLSCRFACAPTGEADPSRAADGRRLDTMAWHLVQQTAVAMGLPLEREASAGHARVVIEFPRTVNEPIKGVSVVEIDDSDGILYDGGALAGSQILVIAPRRETRMLVRDAIRPMGLLVDFVASVEEARRFCAGGLPHAIVYESAIAGDGFERWRQELVAQAPALGFIEVGEQGQGYESMLRDGRQFSRVGRDGMASTLPAALGLELQRALAG